MSEMGDLISLLHNRIASAPDPLVGPQLPDVPPDTTAAPAPTDTTAPPADTTAPTVPPSLRAWLLQHYGGADVLNQDQYNYFGGDEVLRQVQQFDPNARWTPTDIGGGEGGSAGRGVRLDFDISKLPGVGGPGGGASLFDTGFRPVYDDSKLYHPDMVYNDALYGNLTPYRNVDQGPAPFLQKYGPLIAAAIAMGGPAAAGALAGAGIGGGAGLTAAATGSGLSGAAAPWWATAATKALPGIGKGVTAATAAAPAFGRPAAAPVQYDPTAFNSGGSAAKPTNNDSSLVATQFAPDPYGFSQGQN